MHRNSWLVLVASALVALAFPAQAAGDVESGKTLADKQCAACHGPLGEGKGKNPPLAGLDEGAHVAAMQDYKSGARKHAMMEKLATKLSDQEIADMAAYYASLK